MKKLLTILLVSGLLSCCGPAEEASWEDLNDKAINLRKEKQFVEAEKLADESLKLAEEAFGHNHPNVALTLNNSALISLNQGNYEKVETLWIRCLEIHENALGTTHPFVAKDLLRVALLYIGQRKYDKAESFLRRALSIREEIYGADHPELATNLCALAELLKKTGRDSEALQIEKRIDGIWAKAYAPFLSGTADKMAAMSLNQ